MAPLMQQDERSVALGGGRLEERIPFGFARNLRIADRIVVTGMVPSSEIPSLIQSCDLLVHPSYREGLPRVVVQAMLAGVPVVATDADGTRDVCVPRKQVDWCPSAMLKSALRPPGPSSTIHSDRNNGPKKPKPRSVPSSPSMPTWTRGASAVCRCWLEAVVCCLAKPLGWLRTMFAPTLTTPTYQTVLREALEAECQSLGDPDIGQVEPRRGWRQLIVAHLKAADQDPAGDRFLARAIRMPLVLHLVDQKIAEGNLALWMQLGIAEPKPGHVASVCALLNKSTRFSEAAIRILQSDLKLIRDGSCSLKIFDNGLIFLVFEIAARPPRKRKLFLSRQAFRRGVGPAVAGRYSRCSNPPLNPNTRTQAWHEAKVYDALHPVLELLGRVGSS